MQPYIVHIIVFYCLSKDNFLSVDESTGTLLLCDQVVDEMVGCLLLSVYFPILLPHFFMLNEGTLHASLLPASIGTSSVQRPVEVECGADKGQVGERLRKVSQRFTARACLLRIESQVIGVAEHLFEQESCLLQPS